MMEIPESQSNRKMCAVHPLEPAIGKCIQCNKPVCKACGVWYYSRLYCPLCYHQIEYANDETQSHYPSESRDWRINPRHHLFIFLIIILVLTGGLFIVRNQFLWFGYFFISLGVILDLVLMVIIWRSQYYFKYLRWVFEIILVLLGTFYIVLLSK